MESFRREYLRGKLVIPFLPDPWNYRLMEFDPPTKRFELPALSLVVYLFMLLVWDLMGLPHWMAKASLAE